MIIALPATAGPVDASLSLSALWALVAVVVVTVTAYSLRRWYR